jgi:hypothetical protein
MMADQRSMGAGTGMEHRTKRGRALGFFAIGWALATACCGFPGIAGASTPPNRLTGFGAPLKRFAAEHPPTSRYLGAKSFGPLIASPSGPVPEFTIDGFAGSLMTNFLRSLPENTSNSRALTMIKTQLPPDAVMTSQFGADSNASTAIPLTQSGPPGVSCEIVAYHSATLARLQIGNDGDMFVELAYDGSDLAPTWKPTNVNTASYELGSASPDDITC